MATCKFVICAVTWAAASAAVIVAVPAFDISSLAILATAAVTCPMDWASTAAPLNSAFNRDVEIPKLSRIIGDFRPIPVTID